MNEITPSQFNELKVLLSIFKKLLPYLRDDIRRDIMTSLLNDMGHLIGKGFQKKHNLLEIRESFFKLYKGYIKETLLST